MDDQYISLAPQGVKGRFFFNVVTQPIINSIQQGLTLVSPFGASHTANIIMLVLILSQLFNRPYSYSQYWTGTSLKWRLMRGIY